MTKEDVLRITLQKVKENLKNNEIKIKNNKTKVNRQTVLFTALPYIEYIFYKSYN